VPYTCHTGKNLFDLSADIEQIHFEEGPAMLPDVPSNPLCTEEGV
jgi:hypothetical protein